MIFITKNNIVEVSNWALRGNEIFSEGSIFHEILNPLFSFKSEMELKKRKLLKAEIEEQIKNHSTYIDLRELIED